MRWTLIWVQKKERLTLVGESKLSPLQNSVQIVNPDGTPTPYFIQLLQQLYEEKSLTDSQVELTAGLDLIAGAGLSGGGPLNGSAGDITLSASVQAILNLVSTTRGAILYRGAAVWSALLPGAAGSFLKTNGAGADPVWDVAGGGGGGLTTLGKPELSTTQSPSVNFYIMKMVLVDANFTINKIAFEMSAAVPTTKYQPFVYASSAAGVPGALLGSGAQVTGAVAGYNEAPLSAPVNVLKGQLIWIGANVTTAALAGMWAQVGGLSAFSANGGSTVPANPSPGVTTFISANSIYAFWAVT